MAVVGSVLFLIFMALTIIPWAIVMMVGRLFLSEPVRYRIGEAWCSLMVYALKWLCGVKWRVHGIENLPSEKNARIVVLSKHQSAWETFALNGILQRNLVYVFKKELLNIPFFGWAIGSVDMIHIDRSARMEAMNKVAEQGSCLIDQGRWVIMFPEGTRTPRGQTVPYKSGGARIALMTKADIVPVALSSGKCWPKGTLLKKPGMIDVVIGPVITSEGKTHHQLITEVQTWIEAQMRLIDPEAYTAEKVLCTQVKASETE